MIYFDDLTQGDTIDLGTISTTREQAIDFARRYDPQAFHLSDEDASQTYFERLSLSGWHTLGLILSLIGSSNSQWPVACEGCEIIRDLHWLAPVYPDDHLQVTGEVVYKHTVVSMSQGRTTLALTASNQDNQAVCEVTLIVAVTKEATA